MKQVAVDSSGKINRASDSALASCCPMMDGLRVAKAPDSLRAAGHLCGYKDGRIIPLLENCDRPKLRSRKCPMRCYLLRPDIHPLPMPRAY